MKVMVLGIRGLPKVQGGVETHAENLYEKLAALGCQVEAIVRTPFVPPGATAGPIALHRIWSPRTPGFEALVHSFLGVLYAGIRRPDILHVHAVGPAIVTPLARLLRLKVVVTHHGPDYDRDKWGAFARWVLQIGESAGMRCANERIVISKVIAELVRVKYGVSSVLIPNGVRPVTLRTETDELQRLGLQAGKYFLQVSRLVPEKRQLDLLRAFELVQPSDWKLALVGGLDTTEYCRQVQAQAGKDARVVLTGFKTGAALEQLYSHAGAFVLPSSHEGLPIALLEALSYGLRPIASNIPANLEIALPAESYFPVGDVAALASRMRDVSGRQEAPEVAVGRRKQTTERYNWDAIALQTLTLYRSTLQRR